MPLIYLLLPGGLFLWALKQWMDHSRGTIPTGPAAARARAAQTSESSVASYLDHLELLAHAAAHLDSVKPVALRGDVSALMESGPEIAQALEILARPVDALTFQRDLNVLGAEPALRETGRIDESTRAAVRCVQQAFGQVPTGKIDSDARIAIAYSVGCLQAQRCGVGGGS